jgi:hypothetical protein
MRPESDRPAYVAGTLTVGEESLDVLDLEALLASAARASEPASAEAQS